jgi:hypothetical protein
MTIATIRSACRDATDERSSGTIGRLADPRRHDLVLRVQGGMRGFVRPGKDLPAEACNQQDQRQNSAKEKIATATTPLDGNCIGSRAAAGNGRELDDGGGRGWPARERGLRRWLAYGVVVHVGRLQLGAGPVNAGPAQDDLRMVSVSRSGSRQICCAQRHPSRAKLEPRIRVPPASRCDARHRGACDREKSQSEGRNSDDL